MTVRIHALKRSGHYGNDRIKTKVRKVISEAFPQENLQAEILAVDKWVNGTEEPPEPVNVPAVTLYGLCYLTATNDWRPAPNGDIEENRPRFKKLFFRQFVSYVRAAESTPPELNKVIDAAMQDIGLPVEFHPEREGKEVVAVYVGAELGTLFAPLQDNVDEAVRMFFRRPDDDAEGPEINDWLGLALCFITVLAENRDSPCHGNMIRRVLSCYLGVAKAASDRREDWDAIRTIIHRYTKDIEPPDDLDFAVRELEIDIGDLSPVESPKRPGTWRTRRKARRRRKGCRQ